MRCLWIVIALMFIAGEGLAWTDNQIADAIYKAEGGRKTSYPYGILKRYKHTTPRQACLNTIAHAKRDWNGKGDFIEFLGNRYCPVGCDNDNGTNKYWLKNVRWFLSQAQNKP